MTTMIERACIAIVANEMRERGMSEDGIETIMAQPEAKAVAVETYSTTVRAALQAIREPDDAMLRAGIEAAWADPEALQKGHRAMIDHILNEPDAT